MDLDETRNPGKATDNEPGLAHPQFASGGMNNGYLDEPGLLFSLVSIYNLFAGSRGVPGSGGSSGAPKS